MAWTYGVLLHCYIFLVVTQILLDRSIHIRVAFFKNKFFILE